MIMNRRYDGFAHVFGADDYVPYDPNAPSTTPDNYVQTQPEQTAAAPGPGTGYDSTSGIPYSDSRVVSEQPATSDNQYACGNLTTDDCAAYQQKKYGGDTAAWRTYLNSGKTTVGEVKTFASQISSSSSSSGSGPVGGGTPAQFMQVTSIPNCGVPLARYICKSDENCGQCLWRAQQSGAMVPNYSGPAINPNTPTQTTATASRLTSVARKVDIVGMRLSKGAPKSSSGGIGGLGLAIVAGLAFMALRK